MSTAHVIEVGDVTAGIVVAERGGFRFFTAERLFKALDGAVFRTIAEANRAVRDKLKQRRH
ncbi:hypothetical protein [Microvirga flavescens]|uniref:hypothetical protein n=1 Tax=Microvirga flavescens TaxID=2249811 RepID=UPI000DD7C050|nr:hypothetical protein [Microvirga flavescens]